MRFLTLRLMLLLTVTAALAVPFAQAQVQIIDQDTAPPNADISNFFPGVTLSAVFPSGPNPLFDPMNIFTGPPVCPTIPNGPIFAAVNGFPFVPPQTFGFTGSFYWGRPCDPSFNASFVNPVQAVAVDFSSDEGATMYAYDSHGVLIGSDTEAFGPLFIAVGGNQIASIKVQVVQDWFFFDASFIYDMVLFRSQEFEIGYAANLGAGDSSFNLTSAGTVDLPDPGGDICANVYVFAPDQQLIECCSCPLTPNHLKTLSARQDLIKNNLTPGVPDAITVAFVPSTTCDAATVSFGNLVTGLAGWGTTLHAAPGGSFKVTETKLQHAELSAQELQKMTSYCGFIKANGSSFGICNSCQEGAQGARSK